MSNSIRDLSPERWARVQQILDRIWSEPEGPARERLLAELCGDDLALEQQVRRLLDADRGESPLDTGLAGDALQVIADREEQREDMSGELIGHYRLVRKVGEGGMGVVYLGERADGVFEQQVAVKLLRGWVGSDLEQHRFGIEQQVLATLDHPAIASLYDGGRTGDGRAWFIMEYVEGVRITEYCRRHELDLTARLALVLEVAQALQYAHRKLIVHRDVKPSNILVTAEGRVKLLDFGIAKLIGDGGSGASITRSDERPMTIEYAAPEQIRGREVTVQTDVYQLGVVLYELLTGLRPFQRRGGDLYELAREICDRGAMRPSQAVSQSRARDALAADAGEETDPQRHDAGRTGRRADAQRMQRRRERRLAGDPDAIVMRALAREPEERYASMDALISDIRAYLAGRPVAARPHSFAWNSWLFLRRHPRATAAAALFLVMLTSWATTATVQSRRLANAYAMVQAEEQKASQTAGFLENIFRSWDPNESPGEQILVRDMLDRARDQLYAELDETPEVRARLMFVLAGLYKSLGLYQQHVALARDSLEIRRALYPSPDARLVETAQLLAEGLTEVGQYAQAADQYDYALDQARQLDDNIVRIASLEGGLAFTLHSISDNQQALERYEQAIALFRDSGNTDHLDYAGTLANYAKLLPAFGRFNDAVEVNNEALTVYQRRYGRRHHEVAILLNQRGYLMTSLGEFNHARFLHEEALDIQLERLNPRHEFVASTRIDLARALAQNGEYMPAREHLVQALATRIEVYGELNSHTAEARFALGTVLRDMGDLPGAEREYRAALAIHREVFGPDHSTVGMDMTRLASVIHAMGGLEQAASMYRGALERLPPEMLFRSTALFGYGKVLADQGRPDLARPYLQEALRIRRAVVPDGHPRLTEIETVIAAL
jgi:serine/threonine protein kinase/Tfp pilus assembly protein PilF